VCAFKNLLVSNNIIVNNGVNVDGHSHYGINYYHYTGDTTNIITNNMVYGNLPANYAIHDVACTPNTLTCPAVNQKIDTGTSVTFANFQSDTWLAPASAYNATNYRVKAESKAYQNGSTTCAPSPGIDPCVPAADFTGAVRLSNSSLEIGAFEHGSSSDASNPAAPTGLTATVH
jgi:hypothetical protein